jgi:hypothetical protein
MFCLLRSTCEQNAKSGHFLGNRKASDTSYKYELLAAGKHLRGVGQSWIHGTRMEELDPQKGVRACAPFASGFPSLPQGL